MIAQVVKTVLIVSLPIALAMFALSYLLVAWRRRRLTAQSSMREGRALIPIASVSFVVVASGFGLFNAFSTYTFGVIAQESADRFVFDEQGSYGPVFDTSIRGGFQNHRTEIVVQLWINEMLPPPLRVECHSDSEEICELIRSLDYRTHDGEAWYSLLVGLTTTILYSAMIWAFVLRKRADPQVVSS